MQSHSTLAPPPALNQKRVLADGEFRSVPMSVRPRSTVLKTLW